ncbi:hypothetical protein Bca52824_043462 [Brassica carinata]|uniref:Uncharacterized protein n=1 Tax=Brassica carinata TaxID=52824 RepID=A0A8X7S075_BRACI|nr:hypothetical protein Bca52824_043462 [Brassica carinata]
MGEMGEITEGSTESAVKSSVEGNRRQRWETMRMISRERWKTFPTPNTPSPLSVTRAAKDTNLKLLN